MQSKPKVVANSKKEESTQTNKSTKENKQVKSQGEMEQDNQQNQQDEEMTCSNMWWWTGYVQMGTELLVP